MFVNRVAIIAGIEGKPQVRIMSIVVHWESSCMTFVTCDLLLDGILEATAQLVTGISNKRLIQMSPYFNRLPFQQSIWQLMRHRW